MAQMPPEVKAMLEGQKVAAPQVEREKDVVYAYMYHRNHAKQVPNISPFVVKLESWLRINKVAHEMVETFNLKASPTKQVPFIRYNDTLMADSSLIIEYLTKELGLDASEGLTPEQRGIARAVTKLVEEELSYTIFTWRYQLHVDEFAKVFRMNPTNKEADAAMKAAMKENIGERMRQIGIGRKTEEQIAHIGREDVRALSDILGDKQFFMGGDKPTTVDCSVFAMLTQLFVDVPYPHKAVLEGEGKNLTEYFEHMKKLVYPDWKEIVDESFFEY